MDYDFVFDVYHLRRFNLSFSLKVDSTDARRDRASLMDKEGPMKFIHFIIPYIEMMTRTYEVIECWQVSCENACIRLTAWCDFFLLLCQLQISPKQLQHTTSYIRRNSTRQICQQKLGGFSNITSLIWHPFLSPIHRNVFVTLIVSFQIHTLRDHTNDFFTFTRLSQDTLLQRF